MSGAGDEIQQDAIEAGITAAAEAVSEHPGMGRHWRSWGAKEMLIASTAATVAVEAWRKLHSNQPQGEQNASNFVAGTASKSVPGL